MLWAKTKLANVIGVLYVLDVHKRGLDIDAATP